MSTRDDQQNKVAETTGFIAALDQSGGSTPKALRLYGVEESSYNNDDEMFDLVHAMRTRIMTDEAFEGSRVMGAILFENTLDREVAGRPSSQFLWFEKRVVPFLKVDKGLADEDHGVQLMKPIPDLDNLLDKAAAKDVFGTKMRSVIKSADETGIQAVVDQQFEIGRQILAKGLVPIIEPEVDINSPDKAECETILKAAMLKQLDALVESQQVMLKLTLPNEANFYADCIAHPRVLKVVALSGGYSRDDANQKLSQNNGMVASFSRALTEGLSAQQSDGEFHQLLDAAIGSIFDASST